MAWLKARLVSFYQQLPASGYGLAIVPAWLCGLLSSKRHGWPGPWLEWLAFVLAPAIAAALHLVAPRSSRGGRWYWILAGVWFGAALTGTLAHWRALDPYTPWFSLARYVLLSAGVLLFYLSYAMRRWCFGRPVQIRGNALLWKIGSYGYVVIAVLAIAYLFYLTPFRLVLAPRHRTVAVPNSMIFSASAARPAVYLLNTDSGRLSAVPVGLRFCSFVSDVGWSRDGRKLLFTGSDYLTDEFGNSESQDYLGLIEGL